jgi:hypothetical protein
MRAAAIVLAVGAVLSGSCTLKDQSAPPLVGPSELSISISLAAIPDILPTDGGSRSTVTVIARDAYGRPLRNLTLRAEIRVHGVAADLGTLSAHNAVTDSTGRTTVIYTAPAIDGDLDTETRVEVAVTPIGSNFANALIRTTTIRLVPSVLVR